MTPTEELIAAILAATDNVQLQRALLVGSYGESGWDPYDSGSGGGGAFGFTPPSYPAWLETAAPAVQVAAILPAYQSAQAQLPSSITNPAAQAQWIAIAAERPEFDTAEMATIQATNAPTTYGANSSYTVQNWAEIVALTSPKEDTMEFAKDAAGNYYRLTPYTPDAGQAPNTTVEQWRSIPAAIGQEAAGAGIHIFGPDALALFAIHKP